MRPAREPTGGFTLMELLLAAAVSAVVLAAINALFFSAVRLRDATFEAMDQHLPVEYALGVIRRDLQGVMLSPSTNRVMSGDFRIGEVSSLGCTEPVNIELYTTTGTLHDNEPWAEVQRVTYRLRQPAIGSAGGGRELVRGVARNLLATITPVPEEEVLLSNIRTLEIECYDGWQWRNTWDSTQQDTGLPRAVRVRMVPASTAAAQEPIELLVPIGLQVAAPETETPETP